MPKLQIQLLEGPQVLGRCPLEGAVELGRQDQGEPAPTDANGLPCVERAGQPRRVLIAPSAEKRISRKHVQIEPLEGNRVRITNRSDTRSVRLHSGEELPHQGDALEVALPVVLLFGARSIRIQPVGADTADNLMSLSGITVAPGSDFDGILTLSAATRATGDADMETLVRWIQATMSVLHSAASSDDFFQRAARALVELVGLDTGRVLLRSAGEWKIEALQRSVRMQRSDQWEPSRHILARLVEEKRTFWRPLPAGSAMESLLFVETIVAAPILDRKGEVIGALYGDRQRGATGIPKPITRMEALLVELLAGGVAAGLARLTQEKAALKAQIQLENSFTPRIAKVLAEQPELLEGRDANVTVLVCDIRGFSRFSEKLGPAVSVNWINMVMGELTECVLQEEGVVVDYVGDELMAMWGAPFDQPDQALRACRAGRAMMQRLPEVNRLWAGQLQGPTEVGIGIHSGPAHVGNVGSRFKFKYGPLGNTVNMASRVQGVNKYLTTQMLLTRTTFESMETRFSARRIGKVRVHNIQEPVELFEPLPENQLALQGAYERALDLFEEKAFAQAASVLGRMLTEYPKDGPTLLLLSRTVQSLVNGAEEDHPVWVLQNK